MNKGYSFESPTFLFLHPLTPSFPPPYDERHSLTGRDVGSKEEKIGETDGNVEGFRFSPDEKRDGNETGVREEDETTSKVRKGNPRERGEASSEEGGECDEDLIG